VPWSGSTKIEVKAQGCFCTHASRGRSFNAEGEYFALFFSPFGSPFFHQRLERLLFVLFLAVLAFTHVSLLDLALRALVALPQRSLQPVDVSKQAGLDARRLAGITDD
jgi:hypothetical protein